MNARKEFLKIVKDVESVLCAYITLYGCDIETNCSTYEDIPQKKSILKKGWNSEELETFLQSIDYDYSRGFGAQELFGYIWMKDGTWIERFEYDGSESWEHKIMPKITNECIGLAPVKKIFITKDQAIKAMKNGNRISHDCFCKGEWMTMVGNEILLGDDGERCSIESFWQYRTGKDWEDRYFILPE